MGALEDEVVMVGGGGRWAVAGSGAGDWGGWGGVLDRERLTPGDVAASPALLVSARRRQQAERRGGGADDGRPVRLSWGRCYAKHHDAAGHVSRRRGGG